MSLPAQRALVEIGQFTKDVRHIAGLKNVASDFLSRIPPDLKGSAFVDAVEVPDNIPPLHITPEAPLSALKSAIAENGMGVTSRP